jgi:small conductance mechanosensitive channel
VVTIALVIAATFLVWEVASAVIEGYLRRKEAEAGTVRSARMSTLLPLFKISLRVVLIVMAVMLVFSELGVDIGPLLAGAGVVGLAIGFGAQTLVKDLITGVFILVEDIIAVGDWVDVGNHAGMVEGMSIRTLRLRDLSGDMRVVPFGEVTSVHKVARDFSYALMDIGVAYREDVDEVMGILQEVGAGMESDPEWGQFIIEPIEVLGLNSFGASSVDIRTRLKTAPLKQWSVRREFYRRLKAAFDERGIEIPFPHQTIYFGVDRAGNAPPARIQVERLQRQAAERKAAE